MNHLYQKSLQIIIENQTEKGAFVACPNFETYQNAWFRDGSFCAYALTRAGLLKNAFHFYQWASQVVLRYQAKIENCIAMGYQGKPPSHDQCFHSRFTLDGYEVPGNWGFHQLDGLGTWLWAMNEYHQACPDQEISSSWVKAAGLVKDYLAAMWKYPCSDCWEDNENGHHTYTLAAIYSGLQSYSRMFHDATARDLAAEVSSDIFKHCVGEDYFLKSTGVAEVDANLLALNIPFALVDWNDRIFQNTVDRIQKDLATPIGLHRYRADTYYGGGEWVLLTAWLGWIYAQAGERDRASAIRKWIEDQASPGHELPEQIPHAVFDESSYKPWVKKWGAVASPLLWSHAMYILLTLSMEGKSA